MSNTVTATGNLASDPEIRFIPSGAAVADFTVCDTPRKFNKQTQEWEDAGETLFLRCSIWREDAELAAETLHKGQRVTVTGRLKQRSFDTKEGEKRTVIELEADSVAPHGKKDRAPAGPGPYQGQGAGDPWAAQVNAGRASGSQQPAEGSRWTQQPADQPPF